MFRVLAILFMTACLAIACDDASKKSTPEKVEKPMPGKAKSASSACGGGIVIVIEGVKGKGEPELSGEGPEEGKGWQDRGNVVGRCGLGAGEWTVTAELRGYKTATGTANVVDGKTQVLRLHMQETGSVRLTGARAIVPKKLERLDGKVVKSNGGFPSGLYRAPGYKGLHFAVATGKANVVHVSKTPTNAIVVGGLKFALDSAVKVLLFNQPGGYDTLAASAAREKKGKTPLVGGRVSEGEKVAFDDHIALSSMVQMAMLHTDLSDTCAELFKVLTKKGLSTHFCIDFDGTIYQGLDLGVMAFHGGEANNASIGIDLNNLGKNLARKKTANAEPYNYKHPRAAEMRKHPRKKSKLMQINGGKVQHYGYTEAQYASLGALLRALTRIFPQIHATYPSLPDGEVIANQMENGVAFQGIVAHWHISTTRWDPGPGFDWKRLGELLKATPEK